MPELPEVEALAHHLREHAVGRTVTRVDLASMTVLKTVAPAPTDLYGRAVTGASRYGKFLSLDCGELHLVTHLSRAGWLRWSDELGAVPPKPGKGPLALRVHLGPPGFSPGFDLTEAGTQKRLAVYVVTDPSEVPGIQRLGPDALALSRPELAELLAGRSERIKTTLTDQTLLAGVGNAYSDEILHAARLSPYATSGRLDEDALDRLFTALREILTSAVDRSVGQAAARLKGEKRAGLRVHARTGLPCPVCGDTVREVSFADKSMQYCPTCQTGGKPLADRRLSRLLK
ncbi:formamidopyrimidine-DNA glycosylase [Crossiella equi]|uniref:Formamidopyrimidine-DNA glycosylase n=1 Tax=Crossiella equi TaxID=130796 RepID=A0ABS5AFT2_9PSEU|nr:DNA-formamidopyrimidine glycosylase family protein [Crossiella equi]MBP2475448.1 formamidopyrimidine-DNA glycosylase [Crossiella equi]